MMAGTYALSAMAHGGQIAWLVPTYRNARAAWRFAEAHAGGLGRINRAERTIEIRHGRLSVYSADNDTAMRGEAFDLIIVDEAALIREETYTDVLLPTLADRNGRVMLVGTPVGRNWFWREWTRGRRGEPGYAAFQAPTRDNPMPTIQRAADIARHRVSDRTYRQEWLAEFVDDAGGVFRDVRGLIDHVPITDQAGGVYVAGIDWGREHDYTVIAIVDVAAHTLAHVDRWTGIPYALQIQRLLALLERYPCDLIIAEKNAMGGPIVEQLFYEHNVPIRPFTTTHQSKAQIIDALALAIERRSLGLRDVPWLIDELEAFAVLRQSAIGLPSYGAPDGMHDDGVIALALAWRGVAWWHGGAIDER